MRTNLSEFVQEAKQGQRRKVAVAASEDKHVLEAVRDAIKEGIVEAILVGSKPETEKLMDQIGFERSWAEIIPVSDPIEAASKAVSLIREKQADVLMKGLVQTATLLKIVLDKEKGLRSGALLSHLGLFQSPYYHKLLAVTDAGMNVAPSFEEKVSILTNAVDMFHSIGVEKPKVAVVAAVETVNPKMDATVHAALLTQMNRRGQIKGCIIDGPLALDNAVSKEAALHKGIDSEVAGDADILLVPDIESGNLIYKALNFLGGAVAAGVILGAGAPIVLTSRADSEQSKHYSIALAVALSRYSKKN
ncbi:MAG: phosphate butyryltransferase [Spirochaetales bacterium]